MAIKNRSASVASVSAIRGDDHTGEVEALDALAIGQRDDAAYATALQGLSDARAMAASLNNDSLVGLAYSLKSQLQWVFGRIEMAVAVAKEGIRQLTSPADVQWRIDAAGFRVMALAFAGRYPEVDAVAGDVLHVAEEGGSSGAIFAALWSRDQVYALRSGDLRGSEARMHAIVAATSAIAPYNNGVLHWAAALQAERGDRQGALARRGSFSLGARVRQRHGRAAHRCPSRPLHHSARQHWTIVARTKPAPYAYPMNTPAIAPLDASDSTLSTVLASAAALVVQFPECFWFWRPDVRLTSADDVRLVVQNLRKYGNREAWTAAQQLDQCLSANFKKPS